MARLAETRWRGGQAGEDAVARDQALGCSLVEVEARLTERQWRDARGCALVRRRRGQTDRDAVARGQALGSNDRLGIGSNERLGMGSSLTEAEARLTETRGERSGAML